MNLRPGALLLVPLMVGLCAYLWADEIDAATGTPAEADTTGVELEVGQINFGPVTSSAPERHVTFGSNDGMGRYFAASLTSERHYARVLLAPTTLHVWPVGEEYREGHALEGRSTDPTASRWHYRTVGTARDEIIWHEVIGGWRVPWRQTEARVGGGIIGVSQTDHSFWGASVGVAPQVEASGSVGWRWVGAGCGVSVARLGTPLGRWGVLEHAAGVENPDFGRWLVPVACGVSLRAGVSE